MGSFSFRPAIRENVGLIIGLAGGTGSGKTFSALELASGIAGSKPFAVIDTEAGRAKHYADRFRFDHGDLRPPFRPDAYLEAIMAADAAHYPVIVVDSMSHEHAGEGGLLDWHEEEMAGRGESYNMKAWIKPKMAHKKMVARLLQIRAHLILCFRAEEKVDITKDEKGKTVIIPKVTRTGLDGWVPVAEKSLPYELTASFLLLADHPGIPHPIKLEAQHRPLFPDGKPITRECGRLIAEWASGGARNHARELAQAQNLDELKAAWLAIPATQRGALTAAKDARKAELEAPPEPPDGEEPPTEDHNDAMEVQP